MTLSVVQDAQADGVGPQAVDFLCSGDQRPASVAVSGVSAGFSGEDHERARRRQCQQLMMVSRKVALVDHFAEVPGRVPVC